ncbi:VRR-NUC domain-containing protein [Schizophyllum fasciatum]
MSLRVTWQAIFGEGYAAVENNEEVLEGLDDAQHPEVEEGPRSSNERPSLYVHAFETMVKAILAHEAHLLSEAELECIQHFVHLPYPARYTLVRLVLRKAGAWHPVSSMQSFVREVGEEGVSMALDELCKPLTPPEASPATSSVSSSSTLIGSDGSKTLEGVELAHGPLGGRSFASSSSFKVPTDTEIIDLTMDEEQECVDDNSGKGAEPSEFDLSFFCRNEEHMDLDDVLNRLQTAQLKVLMKQMKAKDQVTRKEDMILSLRRAACNQKLLNFAPIFARTQKPSGALKTQEGVLKKYALKELGRCLQVNMDFIRFVRRMHIIFYRSTELPNRLLLPALLSSFRIRSYPDIGPVSRDGDIWKSREAFLEYEDALLLQAEYEELMGGAECNPLDTTNRFDSTRSISLRPATPAPKSGGAKRKRDKSVVDEPGEAPISLKRARQIEEVFDALVYRKWKKLLKRKRKAAEVRAPGLERFEAGYIYTRLVYKAAHAFGMLKMYERELEVLDALLNQRFWRRSKVAEWYGRQALIQMNHLCGASEDKAEKAAHKEAMRECARATLLAALDDPDVGAVYRPGLLHRLQRLEKLLKMDSSIPEPLGKPKETWVVAERIHKEEGESGWSPGKENRDNTLTQMWRDPDELVLIGDAQAYSRRAMGKSVWKGREDQQVNVETVALQHYETLGYKGFHAETRILTTLFALLFWDVLFARVPGVFVTEFQTAPLDLAGDTFYDARKELIEKRLAEVAAGEAKAILQRNDKFYRESRTFCIGVSWSNCSAQDLEEIVECMGGHALRHICLLFCQDYGGRCGGVPDLIVWKMTGDERCKFVEVKGPGDRASDSQKLWFDSLLRAKLPVDLCHVVDSKAEAPTSGVKRKRSRKEKDVDGDDDRLSTPKRTASG